MLNCKNTPQALQMLKNEIKTGYQHMQMSQRCECLERIATFEKDEVIEAFADKITGNILAN
jgi:hypothetical protein